MTTIKVISQNFGPFIETSNTFLGFSKSNFVEVYLKQENYFMISPFKKKIIIIKMIFFK